jgi:hypothetical protein
LRAQVRVMSLPKGILNMLPEQVRAAYESMSPEQQVVCAAVENASSRWWQDESDGMAEIDQTIINKGRSRAETAEAALQAARNEDMAEINRAFEQRREIERLEAERLLIEQRLLLLEAEQRHRNAVPESKPLYPAPTDIKPDTPLRLEDAAKLYGVTVSTLRTAIRDGDLVASKVAGKLLVIPDALADMMKRTRTCAAQKPAADRKARGSTSDRPTDPEASGDGSSSTERSRSAQAHLSTISKRLRRRSTNTSAKSTNPISAPVIPLKS